MTSPRGATQNRPERAPAPAVSEREHAQFERERGELARTWADPTGFLRWFSHVDHKSIGSRFIVTAFVYFALGGILAALMRLQLSRPDNNFLSPDLYNQIFTMHGTTMMFLFAVPVMLAFGVYFVPLMVGARSIAFPRLVAFGYWMFLFGGIFLYTMFLLNIGPDVGWFSYVPLAGPEYGIGKRPDVWAQLITFTETSGLVVSVALITTVFKLRAPGMALNRIPIFVWAMLIVSFHDRVLDAIGRHRQHVADSRPARGNALLQLRRAWRFDPLAAPLLVFRPPRGLHHLPSGAGP